MSMFAPREPAAWATRLPIGPAPSTTVFLCASSPARETARIATAVYNNGFIRDVVRRRYSTFRYVNGRTITLKNTNELLAKMPECDGMKTGYTGPAGRCLICTAHRAGREVLLVQLGTKTKFIWNDGAAMMGWGLRR